MVAFGVAPALIVYLWVAAGTGRAYGWIFALAYAVCMALRLARFNARIDVEDQPHKSAGFLTGVPAPAGAGMMLLPILLWLASDGHWTWLQGLSARRALVGLLGLPDHLQRRDLLAGLAAAAGATSGSRRSC